MSRLVPILFRLAAGLAFAVLAAGPAPAQLSPFHLRDRYRLEAVNQQLAGRVIDFTHNHGCDRRIYSPALGERRDLYVYLPPGYDGVRQYPGILWLHGIAHDETDFLNLVKHFDDAIRTGAIPPAVIAAPDGSIRGRPALFRNGSFYVNSNAGNFEDYTIADVWGFVRRNFAVRPERDAHLIAGASMGGFGAFNLAFKHRDEFGHIAGVFPPLNLRYADCHGRYFAAYDPNCVMFRDPIRRGEVIGRFYSVIRVRRKQILDPLIGRRFTGSDHTVFAARENPIEMLDLYDIRPGEFGMWIGYGTEDEFNIGAQVEHFVDVAARRGIRPVVAVVPGGHHDTRTGLALFPSLARWATERIGKYTPPGYHPGCGGGSADPLCSVRAAATTTPR